MLWNLILVLKMFVIIFNNWQIIRINPILQKKIIENVKKEISQLSEETKKTDKEKIFWEVGANPIFTVGNKSFVNEYNKYINGINVFGNIDMRYPNISVGIGIGVGENRAVEAAEQAVASPLLETSISGATDAIINVTGGTSLTLFEVEEAAEVIRTSANTDINTIFGAVINENLTDEIIVTVIATGFEDKSEPLYHSYDENKRRTPDVTDEDNGEDGDDESIIPTFLRKRGF